MDWLKSLAASPRLAIKADSLQAILDEIAPTDARAKKVKALELVDNRYVDELEKSGFFDQLWRKNEPRTESTTLAKAQALRGGPAQAV